MSAEKGLAVMAVLKHIIEVAKEKEGSRIKVEINGMEFKKGNGSPRIKFQKNGSGLRITISSKEVRQSALFYVRHPKQLQEEIQKIWKKSLKEEGNY